jgi:hypothetical protein
MPETLEEVIQRIKAARTKLRTGETLADKVTDTPRPNNQKAPAPPTDPGWGGPETIAGTGTGAPLNENERPPIY